MYILQINLKNVRKPKLSIRFDALTPFGSCADRYSQFGCDCFNFSPFFSACLRLLFSGCFLGALLRCCFPYRFFVNLDALAPFGSRVYRNIKFRSNRFQRCASFSAFSYLLLQFNLWVYLLETGFEFRYFTGDMLSEPALEDCEE